LPPPPFLSALDFTPDANNSGKRRVRLLKRRLPVDV